MTDESFRPGELAARRFLRLALSAGFLSAVADRLGWWGGPGETGVAWGSFDAFLAYVGVLNPWVPDGAIPLLSVSVTIAEVLLGMALLLGLRTGWVGLLSGILLLLFAFGMTVGTGLKSALDASVLAASAGAFALASLASRTPDPLSLDALLNQPGGHG